jgi:hypothetical protein
MGKQCPWHWFIIFLWFDNVFLHICSTPPNHRSVVSHNGWIHQLLTPINSTSTTLRMSSSTTWNGGCRRHCLLQMHHLAQATTDAANVWPALVNATRRSASQMIGTLHLHLHLHPSWVLLHVVAALHRLGTMVGLVNHHDPWPTAAACPHAAPTSFNRYSQTL